LESPRLRHWVDLRVCGCGWSRCTNCVYNFGGAAMVLAYDAHRATCDSRKPRQQIRQRPFVPDRWGGTGATGVILGTSVISRVPRRMAGKCAACGGQGG
jgi:hypothetical protein